LTNGFEPFKRVRVAAVVLRLDQSSLLRPVERNIVVQDAKPQKLAFDTTTDTSDIEPSTS